MAFHRKVWEAAALQTEVVPLASLRSACRVDHTDEDTLIAAYGLAAASRVEKLTQKLLTPRQITLRTAYLPCGTAPVFLRGGPVASVNSVTVDGVAVAGCQAFGDSPAHLVPPEAWPIPTGEGYPVVVVYVAGFAAPPADLVQAIRIMTADLYDRRSSASTDQAYAAPLAAAALIEPHVVLPW